MDRAFNGVRDTVTYDDGRITTRHRHDNLLARRSSKVERGTGRQLIHLANE